jgi:hypothetical protein
MAAIERSGIVCCLQQLLDSKGQRLMKYLTVGDLKASLALLEDDLHVYLDLLNEDETILADVVLDNDEAGAFVVLTSDPEYVNSVNSAVGY